MKVTTTLIACSVSLALFLAAAQSAVAGEFLPQSGESQTATQNASQRLTAAFPKFGLNSAEQPADPFVGANRIGGAVATDRYRSFASKAAPTSNTLAARFADANAGYPRTQNTASPLRSNRPAGGSAEAKRTATQWLAQARRALTAGDLATAERLAKQAEQLGIPDSAYRRDEDRPSDVLWDVRSARTTGAVRQAGGVGQFSDVGQDGRRNFPASRALYDRNNDSTRNRYVAAQTTPAAKRSPPNLLSAARGDSARDLYEQGTRALFDHDKDKALALFRQAWTHRNQLDNVTRERLQERLQMLSRPSAVNRTDRQGSPIEITDDKQKVLFRQLQGQLLRSLADARQIQESNPRRAMSILSQARSNIQNSELASSVRDHLLRRADLDLADMQRFIDRNRSQIEFRDRNQAVMRRVERERAHVLEVQEETARLVDQFNTLVDERRYPEAIHAARQLRTIAPDEPVTRQIFTTAKLILNLQRQLDVRDAKERGFLNQAHDVDMASAYPFLPGQSFIHGDADAWRDLTGRRRGHRERGRRRSPQELDILRKLSQPVSVRFDKRPLGEVMDELAGLTDVNLFLDPQGLDQEGVSVDQPVTINLRHDISLKSALMLILEPLHLSYVVRDEVLKITSERLRDGDVYIETYDVADLVMPIPNFVPAGLGIGAALDAAYSSLAVGGGFSGTNAVAFNASRSGSLGSSRVNPQILSQMNAGGGGGFGGGGGGFGLGGPGGLGGAAKPDFDALIDLIQQTIEPTSWDEVGGPGTVVGHDTNLSLVISQTQEVHEQIVDLLEQLRRLQDLQVTIEVRFITLNDNFFERIGIDFDFDIDDNVTLAAIPDDGGPSVTIGLGIDGQPTSDLDIQFTSGSFGAAIPQFGGFDATNASQFGFAILSDIEAFFFIQAAQGDTRTNILQAPKVTLFNGQQAFVSDTTQMPFVISLIPVVGDFAAAQQPVIVVLSEGTFMTVQAVVSNDRRYVRLTIVPFFSKIGDVDTFTFSTQRVSTRSGGDDADPNTGTPNEDVIASNVVQLPSFAFVTVTTTVSVPDGGTVLLGGIKRLSEGRTELGVPMLNKIPYINRLFKNVGIGKSTQSLMMMVTPRIIIQEEEEAKLGIQVP